MPGACDVVQVVHRVVDEVPAERLDGEHGTVAAAARSAPLVRTDGGEPAGERPRGLAELSCDLRGFLLAVALRDGGLVRSQFGKSGSSSVSIRPSR